MRKSSYFAMSLLLAALTAQAADTMGGAGVSGSTSVNPSGTSTSVSGSTPSVNSQGYSTTPQGSTVNNQTTVNPRNSTVETTSRSTEPNSVSNSSTLQGSGPTVTTTTTTGTPSTTTAGTAPDNTRINARDRGNQTLTPGDQGNNRADVTTTSAVRRALVKSDMSTTARNIKIITTNGRVTLRGPVKTEAEKARIEALAKAAAGANAVDNQLDVKASPTY